LQQAKKQKENIIEAQLIAGRRESSREEEMKNSKLPAIKKEKAAPHALLPAPFLPLSFSSSSPEAEAEEGEGKKKYAEKHHLKYEETAS